ncbi:LysR substrate-binding domain-containing protein [Nocardia sp. R6R-6]|uniref:LysR substrate-binding domain-containing protein n=1 Tax=Nocardia sp. R6R-6 TaxID=3459303 RepID=UPI00403E25AB
MSGDVLIRQLEYLIALARDQHFGRAASACHVSQPALSAGLRKLERELEVTIVRRGRRFEGFTPEGLRVLDWARRIVNERDELRSDLDRMRRGLAATIRIGAIPTAVPVLPLVTEAVADRHPSARVHIEILSSADIVRRIAEYDLDAGLTYVDDEVSQSLLILPLYWERYILLTPADGPLAEYDRVDWPDIAGLPLCALTTTMRNRQMLDSAMAEAGVRSTAVVETDTVEALYSHVATGRWSSVIAHTWMHARGVPAGIRAIDIAHQPETPPVGLVTGPSIVSSALRTAVQESDIASELGYPGAGGATDPNLFSSRRFGR